jgi:hypothetical protein
VDEVLAEQLVDRVDPALVDHLGVEAADAAGACRVRPVAERLSAQQAAARLEPRDTLGIPLGPGQPPALMKALGERRDWEQLRVYGALLLVGTELFNHPNVHYLSGFFGPLERLLRDASIFPCPTSAA